MTIKSRIFGQDRTIFLSLPAGYAQSPARYPVIYFTDASVGRLNLIKGITGFLTTSNLMPEVILVGISHNRRDWELTPNGSRVQEAESKRFESPVDFGGADSLLMFIREELIPVIESQYRTLTSRIYIGHSFGGLFGFYAMLKQPGLFNAFIDVDPSLWFNKKSLVDSLGNMLKRNPGFQSSVFISFTGIETPSSIEKLKKVFTKPADYKMKLELLDLCRTETHQSAVLPTISKGLVWIFQPLQLPKNEFGEIDYANMSIQQIRDHFTSPILGAVYPVTEAMINSLAYGKLRAGKNSEAIEIFRYNISQNPESANPFDSLGEALELTGQMKEALAAYEKAVENGRKNNDANLNLYQANRDRVKNAVNNLK
ncbi:MAG: alpha/beta hydrolase-fold protein [Bacteroidota bacterium]